MANIGNGLKYIWTNYLAPTKDEKDNRKELDMLAPESGSSALKKTSWMTEELNSEQIRLVADQCPIVMKGIRKKAMDSVRAWFNLETYDNRGKPISKALKLLRDFEEEADFRRKWYDTIVASDAYGDGYLLILFDQRDKKTTLQGKPHPRAIPRSVKILNSEFIKELDYVNKYYKEKHILHFHYEDTQKGQDYWIHPDRIIHIPCDPLPHKKFGNSKFNLLRNTIKSKINIDIAAGEILAWHAHGIYDIKQDGLKPPERKFWEEVVNQHPGAYIHDETVEIKSINPTAIDPTPFYDFLILNISAALRMPKQVLTGNEPGRVTGAEIGFSDYYKDVKDNQDLGYSTHIRKLYKMILERSGETWKYNIVWNPIYIDEGTEAAIMESKVNAAEKALNGVKGAGGFVDKKEARAIFNLGQIELDLKKIIKNPPLRPQPGSPQPGSPQPGNPSPGKPPEKPVMKKADKKENLYLTQLDTSAKAMITKRKEVAEREKKLGKRILEEQNEGKN